MEQGKLRIGDPCTFFRRFALVSVLPDLERQSGEGVSKNGREGKQNAPGRENDARGDERV
jgi:hypothetical protein